MPKARPNPMSREDSGRIGARRRWGDTPRTVSIRDLDPDTRRLVVLFVEAAARADAKRRDVA